MTRTELLCLVAVAASVACALAGAHQDHDVAGPRVYHNQFAVEVPEGVETADRIASEYGFNNLGQAST